MLLPLTLALILSQPTWRIVHIAVGAGAVLPAAVLALVSTIALLRRCAWGQVTAIVSLSLSLAISLAYGIVRLVLLSAGRGWLALACALAWSVQAALLVYWCRPSIRRYLRGAI